MEAKSWRVPPAHAAIKAGAAVLFAVLAILNADDAGLVLLAGIAAVGLGGFALRDVLAPVRLAADTDGLDVVTGFARRLRLPWAEVTALRLTETRRFGLRGKLLEIDTPDGLHLFSRYDLGVDPVEAREALAELAPHEPGTELSH